MGESLDALLLQATSGASAYKNAVRVIATTNQTLSGLPTIDGVALAEADRAGLAGQTDPKANGIYYVSSGAWVRALDMSKDKHLKLGMKMFALEGTARAFHEYQLTSPTSGSLRLGITPLVFERSGTLSPDEVADILAIVPSDDDPEPVGAAANPGAGVPYARWDHVHTLGPGPHGSIQVDNIQANNGAFNLGDDGIIVSSSSIETPIVNALGRVETSIVKNSLGSLELEATGGITTIEAGDPTFGIGLNTGVSNIIGFGASGTRLQANNSALELRGQTGVAISHDTNQLCTFTRNGSNQVVQTVTSGRAGFGFEATSGSQYCYMRAATGVYADCATFYVRNNTGATNICTIADTSNLTTINGYGTSGMNIGPGQKVGAGAGTPLYLHGQAVQVADSGTSKSGDVNLQLGRVIGTGDQKSGGLKIHDHLGAAVACELYGIDGPGGGTYGLIFQGATAGADGRARSIALGFNSPSQVAFVASTADLTMDSVGIRFRHASSTRINVAVTDTTISANTGFIALEWVSASGQHTKREYWGRVQTTTATTTTAWTSPTIPVNTMVDIEADVLLAEGSVSVDSGASFKIKGAFRRDAGANLVQIGSTTVLHSKTDDVGWSATFDVTGATARVRVTTTAFNLAHEVYPVIRYCGKYA